MYFQTNCVILGANKKKRVDVTTIESGEGRIIARNPQGSRLQLQVKSSFLSIDRISHHGGYFPHREAGPELRHCGRGCVQHPAHLGMRPACSSPPNRKQVSGCE